jgi:hypothetical protein
MATFWSRPCWKIIHLFAFFSDQRQKHNPKAEEDRHFDQFLRGIQTELPCPTCKQHMDEFLESHPYNTYQPDSEYQDMKAFCYTNEFHNFVNRSQQKPDVSVEDSMEQVMSMMKSQSSESSTREIPWKLTSLIIVMALVILSMTIVLIRKRRRF